MTKAEASQRVETQEHDRQKRHFQSEAACYRNQLNTSRTQLENTHCELLWANQKVLLRDQSITLLEGNISELKNDRGTNALFIDAAVQLRLRFLEQAREMIFSVPRNEVDIAIIQDGNKAAHRGSGEIDAALFKADLIPENYKESAETIFRHLYKCDPMDYSETSSKMKRVIDCEASLASLKPRNNNNESEEERDEYSEILWEIRWEEEHWHQDYFESSVEVENLIVKLESLTDDIIQLDRAKNRRR